MAVEELVGPAPKGWKYKTLGEACKDGGGDIQTGPFGSQLHASDYVPVGVPSIMPQNIGDNRIIEDGIARITPEDARRLSRYLVRRGDIVYSRRGNVERRALVGHHEDGWLCGTGCIRVRLGENGADPRYASYYLGHPVVREWIVRHAHGATMPNLNTSILAACPFLEPPLAEQRAIAHILGTLDDKIELNRKQNETLEAMARALFKAWFVDFEPVRAKMEGRWRRGENLPGLPAHLYDLFPDRLVESELGEIPEGWELATLGDVAENHRRGVQPEQIAPGTPYIALEHMPRRCIALSEWGTADELESNKFRFKKGDILFGKLRPYFHKVGVAPIDGVCSTDIVVAAPRSREWFGFALGHVSSVEFVEYTNAGSTGTKMPRTSWADMARYEVVLPPGPVATAFTDLVQPLVERIVTGIHESRTLAALRDALLPKLISGEIRVEDAETFLKERGLNG
ncbi:MULTISPECIES: restriction endonuclease subunit S [unclassified Tepidimonas]|uniref:restriction endonuclease subunit S n=1 Tax=unclassified Tepidimonas TaxID=2631705 RepID=UPI003C7E2799